MKRIAILFLTLSGHSISISEPTPLVNLLMKETASMFELGLDRIDRELKELTSTGGGYSASYDWDKNLIIISKHVYALIGEAPKGYRDNCKSTQQCIAFMRSKFLDETDILCLSSKGKSTCNLFDITNNFNHRGYDVKKFYKEIDMGEATNELHNITILRLNYFGENIRVTCEKMLTDKSAKCFETISN